MTSTIVLVARLSKASFYQVSVDRRLSFVALEITKKGDEREEDLGKFPQTKVLNLAVSGDNFYVTDFYF